MASFAIVALAVHLLLALRLRTIAWPEVTTPAYLWSRGMLMYRDIKFVHTPGLIGSLAIVFSVFGVSTWVVRGFALAWPLIAHATLLRQTRSLAVSARFQASLFFLALLFQWQGNAVWPTAVMMALSLLIAHAVSRGQDVRAGLLIGSAILLKQTAAFLLIVIVGRLLSKGGVRAAFRTIGAASLPYTVVGLAFAIAGAGFDYVRWTLWVPFQIREAIEVLPSASGLYIVLCAFLPIVLQTLLEKRGDFETSTASYLLVAVGFALMAFPRFGLPQMLGAVPCLSVGAGRFVSRGRGLRKVLSAGIALSFSVSVAASVAMGEPFTGKVLFWNDDSAFNTLVERLRRLPPQTPLFADIWENVLPRTGLLPPGRIYVHPWLARSYALGSIDLIEQRVERATAEPGVVTVRFGVERGEPGPYAIRSGPHIARGFPETPDHPPGDGAVLSSR